MLKTITPVALKYFRAKNLKALGDYFDRAASLLQGSASWVNRGAL